MFKHLIKISGILLFLFLVACSTNTETAVPPQTDSTNPEQEIVPVEQKEIESVNDVDTTAAEEMIPVAARPQFIEFYADW